MPFLTLGGATLRYDRAGAGPAVLLIHGWLGNRTVWERQVAALRDRFTVVTVDLRIVSPKAVKNHVTPDSFAYADGPRYASLKGNMAAKKKPLADKTLADYGVTASPVIAEKKVELPPARKAGQIVADIPTLVKKLVEEAKAL